VIEKTYHGGTETQRKQRKEPLIHTDDTGLDREIGTSGHLIIRKAKPYHG
jgi:hypothetical protein